MIGPATATTQADDNGAAVLAGDAAHVWHPYDRVPAQVAPYPVVSAAGTRLRFADGREVIDGMSSWWAAIHGHNHPVLDEALQRQAGRMSHVMLGGLTHPAAVGLARRLVALTPAPLVRVFFSDSGSVAVEVAIKMALQCWMGRGRPAKRRLLTVRGGYHGDTFAAMSVCDPETGMHHLFAGVLQPQVFAPVPAPPFGEPFRPGHIAELAALLAAHADELAAVILEPVVQGAGGMRFYNPAYLAELRRLCDRHDVLLIADEIATGFGRSGELFGVDHAGISPDIMCVGKALTGGYLSMAATLCTDAVADAVCAAEPGALMHGPTFMGNPLAAAVAVASVDLLVASDWRADVRRIEAGLAEGLAPARAHPAVADVRVLGAIGVIETVEPVDVGRTQAALVERGVWLRPFGRLLYTMPPYITTDDEVAQVASAMVGALG